MRSNVVLATLAGLLLTGCVTLNEADQDVLRQHHVSPPLYSKMLHHSRLELPDIMELAERHVSAPFTIRYLRSTEAAYRLKTEDIIVLRHAGVSTQVIDYLLATPTLFAPRYSLFWYDDYDPFWWGYGPVFVAHGHCGHGHHH